MHCIWHNESNWISPVFLTCSYFLLPTTPLPFYLSSVILTPSIIPCFWSPLPFEISGSTHLQLRFADSDTNANKNDWYYSPTTFSFNCFQKSSSSSLRTPNLIRWSGVSLPLPRRTSSRQTAQSVAPCIQSSDSRAPPVRWPPVRRCRWGGDIGCVSALPIAT